MILDKQKSWKNFLRIIILSATNLFYIFKIAIYRNAYSVSKKINQVNLELFVTDNVVQTAMIWNTSKTKYSTFTSKHFITLLTIIIIFVAM